MKITHLDVDMVSGGNDLNKSVGEMKKVAGGDNPKGTC